MSTFFTNIQSLFKAQYDGRYLGLILQEIGNRHSNLIGQFILDSCGVKPPRPSSLRFVAETWFETSKGRRRADLAVFDSDATEPFALVEIKYFDKPGTSSETKEEDQLTAYQSWKDKDKDRRFVLILAREQLIAPNLVVRRWNDLSRHLKKHRTKHGELVGLLIDYLEEKGIVMQNVESRQVISFMKRIVCSRKGAGKNAGNLGGPAEFSKMLSNMKLTAEIFDPDFKAGIKDTDKSVNAATVDFSIAVRTKSTSSDEHEMVVDDHNRLGGNVRIYAQSSLSDTKSWMLFRYGVLIKVAPENSNHSKLPSAYLFAELDGTEVYKSDLKEVLCTTKKIPFNYISTNADKESEKVEAIFRSLLASTANKVLESQVALTIQQKRRVKKLCKDFSAFKITRQ